MTKLFIGALIALATAGCGIEARDLGGSRTMYLARTTPMPGVRCATPYRWLECNGLTPAEVAGGGD